jgi:hypothetical protein
MVEDQQNLCGGSGVWYSPTAVVRKNEGGAPSLYVFARDDNWFDGHIRVAALTNVLRGQRTLHDCKTLNPSGMTLGSAPAVSIDPQTKEFLIVGKEQSGDHLALWKTRNAEAGLTALDLDLASSHALTYVADIRVLADATVRQRPALVVDPTASASHVIYRAKNHHAACDAPTADVSYCKSQDLDLSDMTPAAVVDAAGTFHVFVRAKKRGVDAEPKMYHLFGPAGAVLWEQESLAIPTSDSDNAPMAAIVTAAPFANR